MISIPAWLFNIQFLIGFLALCLFSYLDYKYSEIENKPVLTFLGISLLFMYISSSFWVSLTLALFLFVFLYLLWQINAIGGADLKIMPGIIPFLGLNGFVQGCVGLWFFIIFFGFIGGIYGFIGKYVLKKEKIPFLPAITLTFLVFWLFKMHVWGI